jgi:hypothetical protein
MSADKQMDAELVNAVACDDIRDARKVRRPIKGPKLHREELPANVSAIVDRRCEELVALCARSAAWGTLKLDEIARNCYMQGFMDAYNGLVPDTGGAE